MITKMDCILLLTNLQEQGVDVSKELGLITKSPSIPSSVLKKINDYRMLELTDFYEHIRKNYNNKKI